MNARFSAAISHRANCSLQGHSILTAGPPWAPAPLAGIGAAWGLPAPTQQAPHTWGGRGACGGAGRAGEPQGHPASQGLPTTGLEGRASSSGQASQLPVLAAGPSRAAFSPTGAWPSPWQQGRQEHAGLSLQLGSAGHPLAVLPARLPEQPMGLALGHVQAGSPAELGTAPSSPPPPKCYLLCCWTSRERSPRLQLGDAVLSLAQGAMQLIVLLGRVRRVPAGAQPDAPGEPSGARGCRDLCPAPSRPYLGDVPELVLQLPDTRPRALRTRPSISWGGRGLSHSAQGSPALGTADPCRCQCSRHRSRWGPRGGCAAAPGPGLGPGQTPAPPAPRCCPHLLRGCILPAVAGRWVRGPGRGCQSPSGTSRHRMGPVGHSRCRGPAGLPGPVEPPRRVCSTGGAEVCGRPAILQQHRYRALPGSRAGPPAPMPRLALVPTAAPAPSASGSPQSPLSPGPLRHWTLAGAGGSVCLSTCPSILSGAFLSPREQRGWREVWGCCDHGPQGEGQLWWDRMGWEQLKPRLGMVPMGPHSLTSSLASWGRSLAKQLGTVPAAWAGACQGLGALTAHGHLSGWCPQHYVAGATPVSWGRGLAPPGAQLGACWRHQP